MDFWHTPVLLKESIEGLQIRPDGIYVDGTLGGGGHSWEICKKLTAGGRLIGIDQDQDAIKAASERLDEFRDRVDLVLGNFRDMKSELARLGVESVDGVIWIWGSLLTSLTL